MISDDVIDQRCFLFKERTFCSMNIGLLFVVVEAEGVSGLMTSIQLRGLRLQLCT